MENPQKKIIPPSINVPEYHPDNETAEEYILELKRFISDMLISVRNETIKVRSAMVQIRMSNTLNSAKRLAREFMEARGGS